MAGHLGSGWWGQTGTMTCCPMHTTQDPDFFGGKEIRTLGGYRLGDDPGEGGERSYMWIQTAQG